MKVPSQPYSDLQGATGVGVAAEASTEQLSIAVTGPKCSKGEHGSGRRGPVRSVNKEPA